MYRHQLNSSVWWTGSSLSAWRGYNTRPTGCLPSYIITFRRVRRIGPTTPSCQPFSFISRLRSPVKTDILIRGKKSRKLHDKDQARPFLYIMRRNHSFCASDVRTDVCMYNVGMYHRVPAATFQRRKSIRLTGRSRFDVSQWGTFESEDAGGMQDQPSLPGIGPWSEYNRRAVDDVGEWWFLALIGG
jgi:hypothetical protein